MARIYNLACLVIIAIFSIVTAQDYCNLQSCKQKRANHTMCEYSSSTPAAACGQSYSSGLNDDQKKEIVDIHNKLRQKVASGQESTGNPGPQYAAVSMPPLTWDNELEKIAQRWANQCEFEHDKCRDTSEFAVGQNIAQVSSSGKSSASLENLIQLWYNEVNKFDRNDISSYKFDPQTGHYTQLVWANTTKIGCGLINYKNSKGWNTTYLVCNYGPSGNWIGQKIYEAKN